MLHPAALLSTTELHPANTAELTEQIARAEALAADVTPRSYPGHPRIPLPRRGPRWLTSLDWVLLNRRSQTRLGTNSPTLRVLARLLKMSHGVCGANFRGPVPSAGGLQGLELYLVRVAPGETWSIPSGVLARLPVGIHHYDRVEHSLALIRPEAEPARWLAHLPSLRQIDGGAWLWIVVGDLTRVTPKYAFRAERFLLLEAGHLMQNLCLVSASLGYATTPLGGCLEHDIAQELRLPATDRVLYCGVCGRMA